MSIIHVLILLFLWVTTSLITIKNIENYYKMQKPMKKRNERIMVCTIVLVCLLFRWVISSYIIYVLICNTIWFICHLFIKNKYLDKTFYLTFIIPIIIVILGIINVSNITTTTYNLTNKDLSSSTTLGFISDIHLSTLTNKKLNKLIETVSARNYDVFIIGGDLIDEFSKEEHVLEVINRLGTITTKYGIYYIEGNHDLLTEKHKDIFLNAGIITLLDNKVLINNNYYLVGRRDLKDKSRAPLNSLIYGLDKPIILLDHQPNIEKNLDTRIIIQLSGHTHAGQLWPLNYFVKYGYYKQNRLIVSSGIGAWHNPVRTSKHSEIVEVNISNT